MADNIKKECKKCGKVIIAKDGEIMVARKKQHMVDCHDGFKDIE